MNKPATSPDTPRFAAWPDGYVPFGALEPEPATQGPRGLLGPRALLFATVALPTLTALSSQAQLGEPSAVTAPQPAPSAIATPGPATPDLVPRGNNAEAVKVLLAQAAYWRGQYQADKALESLTRVLALDPANPEALATLAQMQAEAGEAGAARSSLARLKAAAPSDPRLPVIEQALRIGVIDPTALAEARQLAQQGRNADAVQAYRRLFKGDKPPPSLATEYYQTLAGSQGGYQQAQEGLGREVIASPGDLKTQLAYAQLLTYRDGTSRAEGITRLEALSQSPEVGEQAARSLRQALMWLPDQPASVPQLDAYLQRHPGDAEMARKRETAQNPPRDPADVAGQTRQAGFAAFEKNRLPDAERQFMAALQTNPDDADATGGLGLVRLRQGRLPDARTLLARAIALDPAKAASWQKALDGANRAATAGQAVSGQYAQVNRLLAGEQYDAAEALLTKLMAGHGNAGNFQQLGDIQARAGRTADAEASYRQALSLQPRNTPALLGLAGLLARQGRDEEANRLFAQAGNAAGAREAGRVRADQLRAQAQAIDDPVAQTGLFRAAVVADPSSPWLRLELARALRRQGRGAEAQGVMADLITAAKPTPDQLRAGLLFAQESGDDAGALALIARIPPKQRTPEMRDLQGRIAFSTEVADAMAAGSRIAVRQRLLNLAAQPDPAGYRGTAILRAFTRLQDRAGAREAVATAMAATRAPTGPQRLAYASALLEAGLPAEAEQLAASVNPASLPVAQRTALDGLRTGVAVREADRARRDGRPAEAFDSLAPLLARTPDNPDLNMALGRIYASEQEPGKALAIADALVERYPANLDARRAAVQAAIASGDYSRAERYVADGKQAFPRDPRAYMMAADLARARGNNGTALRELQMARELRRQQLGQSVSEGAAPLPVPAATFSSYPAAPYKVEPAQASLPPLSAPPSALFQTPLPAMQTEEQLPSRARPFPRGTARPAEVVPVAMPAEPSLSPPPTYNPFRRASVSEDAPSPRLRAAPLDVPSILGMPAGERLAANTQPLYDAPGLSRLPADPLTADIDRDIGQLRTEVAPKAQVGLGLRGRSGESGTSRLTELMTPMEASFSPGGSGTVKLQVTPTFLQAGSVGSARTQFGYFGSNPLYVFSPGTPRPGDQSASGAALDIGYDYRWFTADVGSTPVGFRRTNVVGGVELSPELAPGLRLRVRGQRRAVTDSVLSYAGTEDPASGTRWGSVVRNTGTLQLEYSPGLAFFYGNIGGGTYVGDNVASNRFIEAGLGGSYAFLKREDAELRGGLGLYYASFDKNLRYFSLGQGGYFSPQTYLRAGIPVTWSQQLSDRLSYEVTGELAWQTFTEKRSAVFPRDPGRQSALEALVASTNVADLFSSYPGQTQSGPAGGVTGKIEYKPVPLLTLGLKGSFQRVGDFTEGNGLLYARYVFGGGA